MLTVPYCYPINTLIQKINASTYDNEIHTKAKIINTLDFLKKEQGIPWRDMLPRKSSHNIHHTPCKNAAWNHYFFLPLHCYKLTLTSCFILSCHAISNIGNNSINKQNFSSYKINVWSPACFLVLIKGGSITSAEILNCPKYHKKLLEKDTKLHNFTENRLLLYRQPQIAWGKIFRASSVGLRLLHCSFFR